VDSFVFSFLVVHTPKVFNTYSNYSAIGICIPIVERTCFHLNSSQPKHRLEKKINRKIEIEEIPISIQKFPTSKSSI